MQVAELLVDTLYELVEGDLKRFKWYLNKDIVDGCKPIPNAHLENTSREETVSKLIEKYGENLAVTVTVTALRKIGNNNAAEKLEKAYSVMGTATPTTTSSSTVAPPGAAAAPTTMMAQGGSVIFAPTISSGTSGAWNITINKP